MTESKSEAVNLDNLFNSEHSSDELKECIIHSQKVELLIEMLPNIFHKLKNKLTPIMGYTQLLYLKMPDEENRKKLSKIEKNADELCYILDQLRQYFQKGKNIKTRINLNDILHHMNSYFEDIEKQKQIDVEIEIDETIPDEYLNFGQIENLVTLLIDNAVQAIEQKYGNRESKSPSLESGKIQIKTRNLKSDFRLIVKDNGIGINREILSKIWLPFYSEFSGRTGIGLLGCEKIITNHDARAQVNSHEGAGTEFEIIFPRKTD